MRYFNVFLVLTIFGSVLLSVSSCFYSTKATKPKPKRAPATTQVEPAAPADNTAARPDERGAQNAATASNQKVAALRKAAWQPATVFTEAFEPNYVPAPWQPIVSSAKNITMFGRNYMFGTSAWLNNMASNGANLFENEAQIQVGGAALKFGAAEYSTQRAGSATYKRSATAQGTTFVLYTTVEFDGYMWCKLKVLPSKTKLERLQVQIPLKSSEAELLHYVGAPQRYESQNKANNSSALKLPTKEGAVYESGLKTMVWVGNTVRGFTFFLESDKNWFPKNDPKSIQITRNGNATTLSVNMVQTRLPVTSTAADTLTYEWGCMATPIKPMPRGWRAQTYSMQNSPKPRGNNVIYWHSQWRTFFSDPDLRNAKIPTDLPPLVAKDRSEGRKVIPYIDVLSWSERENDVVNPFYTQFSTPWRTEPNVIYSKATRRVYRMSLNTNWSDYLLSTLKDWSSVVTNINGYYADEVQPVPNTNAASKGGYTDFESPTVRRPTYSIQAHRRFFKRANWYVLQNNSEDASIMHCSGTLMAPYLGFGRVWLTGEHLLPRYGNNFTKIEDSTYFYHYTLSPDRLRTEFYHRQWGVPMLFLPELRSETEVNKTPASTRDMLSLVQQVDALVWPIYCNKDEVEKTWLFRQKFGIGDDNVTFTPFWENTQITTSRTNILIGYYQKDGKYLLIVSNTNPEAKSFEINLPKQTTIQTIKNAETNAAIPQKGGRINITLPRNDYMAIALN